MKAIFGGTGLNITLVDEDKDSLKLNCEIHGTEIPLTLKISEEVKSNWIEEPGFHIQAYPVDSIIGESTSVEVNLSEERLEELIGAQDRSFISRCNYDRVNIKYFKF